MSGYGSRSEITTDVSEGDGCDDNEDVDDVDVVVVVVGSVKQQRRLQWR